MGSPSGSSVGPPVGSPLGSEAGSHVGSSRGPRLRSPLGSSFGLACGIARGIADGIAVGIVFGLAGGLAGGLVVGLAVQFAGGRVVVPIASGLAGGLVDGITVGFVVGIAGGIASGIAATISFLRGYYLLPHAFFVWPRPLGNCYPLHPVAWDDLCRIPFPGLGGLLAAFAEINPASGATEIERFINSYPSQMTEALRARMMLLARASTRITDLLRLDDIASQMPDGEAILLQQSHELALALQEISTRQARLNTAQRPMLREPYAETLSR